MLELEEKNRKSKEEEMGDKGKHKYRVWDYVLAPFNWLEMLSRETHWSLVFGIIVVYGICQGVGGSLSHVATSYYMKDVQKVLPSEAQFYGAIKASPLMVKPIWGLLTDVIPVLGYRRRPYFLLAGVLGIVPMLFLSLHKDLHIFFAVLCLTVKQTAIIISDVTVDACVAHNSNKHQTLAADMQTLCAATSSIGLLLGFCFAGHLVHLIGPMGVYGLLTIPAALVLLVGIIFDEPHTMSFSYREVGQKFRQATIAMWDTIKHPEVWRPCLYMYLSLAFSLNIYEGMFYWYTDSDAGPHFSQDFVGYILSVGAAGSLLGAMLYQYALKDHKFLDLCFWSQLLLGISGLLDLILVLRLNLKIGIPDHFFAVLDECASQFIVKLKWMPLLVLSTKLCPQGIEGTFFALIMSIDNMGINTSSWLGGILLHVLKITRTRFDNLWIAILVRSIARICPLLVIFLVPRADPSTSILRPEVSSTEESIGTSRDEGVELVSLVASMDNR